MYCMKTLVRRYVPRTRRALGSLLHLHPAPWRWKVGVEAGLALGLPLALFTAIGHQPWGMQAALGAFTALYGASLNRRDRMHLLPLIAVGLVLAAAVGVLCAGNHWLTSVGLIVVGALAGTVALGIQLGPPGPMMFVLVAAVSGHLATPRQLGGAGLPGGPLIGLVALGSALAYLVVILPLALPSVRHWHNSPSGLRTLFPRFGFDADTAAVVLRVVVAVAVASLLSRSLGAYRSYWVVLSAVAVLQSSPSRKLTTIRAVHRVVGTMLGIGLFELLALTHPVGFGVVLLLTLLQAATEVVVARNYALALFFITPLALTNSTVGHAGSTLVTVQGRLLDTLLGAGIALAIFGAGEGLRRLWAWRNTNSPAATPNQ